MKGAPTGPPSDQSDQDSPPPAEEEAAVVQQELQTDENPPQVVTVVGPVKKGGRGGARQRGGGVTTRGGRGRGGRGRGRRASPTPERSPSPTPTLSDPELEEEEQHEDDTSDGSRPPPTKKRSKKKQAVVEPPLHLTAQQEGEVLDWFQTQEPLWNNRATVYRTIDKDALYAAQGATMTPAVSGKRLKRWVESQRDRFVKLRSKAQKSGAPAREYTEKENFLFEKFEFLVPYLQPPRARTLRSIRERQAQLAAPASPPPPPAPADEGGEQEVEGQPRQAAPAPRAGMYNSFISMFFNEIFDDLL